MFPRRIPGKSARGGFSLVEVALALTVAAGGMIAVFGLFPAGLRQSANSNRDLVGSSFAGATLAAIAGNVSSIDDIATWNNPQKWWERAIANTGLPEWNKGKDPIKFGSDNSIFLPNRSKDKLENAKFVPTDTICFFADDDGKRDVDASGIALPPHYIIRLVRVRRKPRPLDWRSVRGYVNAVWRYRKMYGKKKEPEPKKEKEKTIEPIEKLLSSNEELHEPDRYIVSVVSSDQKGYSIFVDEPVYSQEFHFLHRP